MKSYIHNYEKYLKDEFRKLKASLVSEHNQELILRFYEFNFSRDISVPRIIRQMGSLRMVSLFLNKDFELATVNDFERFVSLLKEQDKASATIDTYKEILKVFYKWLFKSKVCPDCVAWFKSVKKRSTKLPESLLVQEDIKEMEKKATNIRDRSLVSVLWESGARIGELGTLQLKNVAFDDLGCRILVDGKTGMRRVRLVNSASNLLEWINKHPCRDNPEAYVWVNLEKSFGSQMQHRNLMYILKRIGLRAGIKKPVNPHHFRHSRATYMAQFLTEAQLKEYFGWVQESDMAAQYVHLSGKQVDDAILRMHGLKEPDKKEDILKQKQCPRCKALNDNNNEYCEKCWLALTSRAAIETHEIENKTQESLVSLMKLIELAGANPEKAKQIMGFLQQDLAKGV